MFLDLLDHFFSSFFKRNFFRQFVLNIVKDLCNKKIQEALPLLAPCNFRIYAGQSFFAYQN